jgi:hypothetical protein
MTRLSHQHSLPLSLGKAGDVALAVDFDVMTALTATERTKIQYEKLLDEAGLKIEKIFEARAPQKIMIVKRK